MFCQGTPFSGIPWQKRDQSVGITGQIPQERYSVRNIDLPIAIEITVCRNCALIPVSRKIAEQRDRIGNINLAIAVNIASHGAL